MAEFDSWTSQRYPEVYCDIGPHEGKMRVTGAIYMNAEEYNRYQRHTNLYLPLEIPEPIGPAEYSEDRPDYGPEEK